MKAKLLNQLFVQRAFYKSLLYIHFYIFDASRILIDVRQKIGANYVQFFFLTRTDLI